MGRVIDGRRSVGDGRDLVESYGKISEGRDLEMLSKVGRPSRSSETSPPGASYVNQLLTPYTSTTMQQTGILSIIWIY